ncbi:hypothetical protein SDC9_104199 [bioreactor metagenome]|uniref:Uncharacterized protein n=1 Tax=bioreactor metagenome TaxID=1076179 RepID=A0A645AW54_9ZZZZ
MLHDIVEQRLRVAVVDVVGGRDGRNANAHLAAADRVGNRAGHFQQQARAVLDGAAVIVGALVGAILEELVQQIAVGRMDFDAVKAGRLHRAAGRLHVVVDDAGQFFGLERARHGGGGEVARAICRVDEIGLGVGLDGGRAHGCICAGLQIHVRNAAHMPELGDDLAAESMHRLGHFLPAIKLLCVIQPGHVGVALCLRVDGRAFGDQQPGACALRVVGGGDLSWHRIGRAVARERRHGDAVVELQIAGLQGGEKRGLGHVCTFNYIELRIASAYAKA